MDQAIGRAMILASEILENFEIIESEKEVARA
jgi:hypothetical protein